MRPVLLAATLLATMALPMGVRAVAPTDAPVLVSPAPGATVNANPVLEWDRVGGAVKYRVQISASPSFSSTIYNQDTYNTRATPLNDLPLGTLYWRVAGTDGGAGVGPYADSSFDKAWGDAPQPTAPADAATLVYPADPPLFTWAPLAGASGYEIEIDDASDFVGAPRYTTANTSWALTEQQTPGQTFYWRVRGKSGTSGVVSAWSAARSYSVSWPVVPNLVAPADGATIEQVILDWGQVVGAARYQVQVSPNGDWANNVIVDVTVRGTRYSPPTGLNNGSYFWRVRARDREDNASNSGAWSPVRLFTRAWSDRPTLTYPADGATVSEPILRWTPVDHAAYYHIEIDTDPNFTLDPRDCYTNHTEWTPYHITNAIGMPDGCEFVGFDPGQVYYWHVRGVDSPAKIGSSAVAFGRWSNMSSSDVFSLVYNPGLVNQTSPADNAFVVTPVLTWDDLPGHGFYHVTIYKASGASAESNTTYATSYTPVNLSAADGPFRWSVTAEDANGFTSIMPSWGSMPKFNLQTPSDDLTMTKLTPANGSSSIRMPSMTWKPYFDSQGTPDPGDDVKADHYAVWYRRVGAPAWTSLSGSASLRFGGFTYPGNLVVGKSLPPGNYEWFAEALTVSGAPITSTSVGTFTIVALDGVSYTGPDNCVPTDTICEALPDTPTLDWAPVDSAGGYKVYIATDADFTVEYRQYWTIHSQLTARESFVDNQAGQAFYWFVQACLQGTTGPCGGMDDTALTNAFAFQKRSAAIELVSPHPDGTVTVPNEITFHWRDFLATNGDLASSVPATQEARQYRIETYTAADYAPGSLIETLLVDQTTYTPFAKTYPEGPIYWRVQAIDASQNSLTFSAVATGSLTKSSPAVALSLPANGANVAGVPYFRWTPQAFANKYELELAKNGDVLFSPSNRVGSIQTTRLAAWSPTTALAAGDYAWRVRRLDADLRAGPWSTPRTFTLTGVAPTLTSPADAATFLDDDLLFSWSTVSGAATYVFQASTASNFSSIYESQTTVMTSWAPLKRYADGTYYWRVQVRDAGGNVLATSVTRRFLKDGTAPTVTAKNPTANAAINGVFDVTFSEPVTGVSATTYKMVVAGTATAVPGTVTAPSTTTARFRPTAALVPGQSYTLTLTSGIHDAAGNSLASTSWTLRTALTVESNSVALAAVWDSDNNTAASGGSYDASRTSGSKTTFRFTGTNVSVLARRATDGGNANVYLDGVKQATVSFYNAATQWQRVVWSKTGLTNAKHTVEIRVLNTKPAASSGTWVYLDAFKIGSTVYQQNHGFVTDSFRTLSAASASGGSYVTTSHLAAGDNGGKPTHQLTFRGTGVDWYATKTKTSGIAFVYIDNVKKATVDLYSATTSYGQRVFASATLSNAVHTVKIVLQGTKQAAATGTDVSVDRLAVR